jgi:hypothetical protein
MLIMLRIKSNGFNELFLVKLKIYELTQYVALMSRLILKELNLRIN